MENGVLFHLFIYLLSNGCGFNNILRSPLLLHTMARFKPFTRRLFNLPKPPPPAYQKHHDLASFLSYAEQTSLPQTASTYIGTHYEYTVLNTLRRFAFLLYRVGGREDAGVDLVGTWFLPARHRRQRMLRVFVQCKALRTKLGPNLVRELEGTFTTLLPRINSNDDDDDGRKDEVGILISTREATKGVRDAMATSAFPLFWMMVQRNGTLQQALWNARVEELGLGLLGVETRYSPSPEKGKSSSIVLTWDGHDLPDMDQVEDTIAAREAEWLASWGDSRAVSSDAGKCALLDIVEKFFPDARIEGGKSSELSDHDRARILDELNGRLKDLNQ